jgi:glycosyltransferase involved in cell wall biosynthesis
MSKTLAVITKQVGALSETFIRRHMEKLLPEKTVVIAYTKDKPYAGYWDVNCPQLIINQLDRNQSFFQRSYQKVINQLPQKQDRKLAATKQFIQQHQVGIIMGEYLDISLPWLPLAQSLGIPFYAHAHGYDVSWCLQDKYWQQKYHKYSQATGIITVNQPSRQKLIALGIPAEKLHVIPCGINVPPQPYQRQEKKTVKCLAVGRMVAKKAPILTLDAFRRACEGYPNLHLDYVGTGALLPAVRQYIFAFNLTDKVTLHQGQPNTVVHQLMQEADIFLQHSMTDCDTGDEEGLPVAILEAMAYALPVVSTKHAGIPEAVEEGKTGFLVEEGNSIAMAERIMNLAQDRKKRIDFGYAAWEKAKEKFSWEREREQLCELMELES